MPSETEPVSAREIEEIEQAAADGSPLAALAVRLISALAARDAEVARLTAERDHWATQAGPESCAALAKENETLRAEVARLTQERQKEPWDVTVWKSATAEAIKQRDAALAEVARLRAVAEAARECVRRARDNGQIPGEIHELDFGECAWCWYSAHIEDGDPSCCWMDLVIAVNALDSAGDGRGT